MGMDGWMDVWMDGWMNGWMNGWIICLYNIYTSMLKRASEAKRANSNHKVFNRYVPGSGVGATSTSVRRAKAHQAAFRESCCRDPPPSQPQ
jgi:hypothetical protein